MVVFRLHLKKIKMRLYIRADTQLLTGGMTSDMLKVHSIIVSIEIDSIIRCNTLSVNFLDKIIVAQLG